VQTRSTNASAAALTINITPPKIGQFRKANSCIDNYTHGVTQIVKLRVFVGSLNDAKDVLIGRDRRPGNPDAAERQLMICHCMPPCIKTVVKGCDSSVVGKTKWSASPNAWIY
jgi:hypothetical protein